MIVILILLTCSIPGALYMAVHFTAGIPANKLAHKLLVGFLIAVFFTAAFLAPALTFSGSDYSYGTLYNIYYYALYFASVTSYLLLILLILRRLCTAALFRFKPEPPSFRRKADRLILMAALLLSLYALYSGMRVPAVRTLTLTSPKLTQPVDLVVLSDLHINRVVLPSKLRGIVQRTNALNPDYILLPGDTVDDQIQNITPHLALLKTLRAKHGIYAVGGNHELYIDEAASRNAICDAGITWLQNDGRLHGSELYIAGVPYRGSGLSPYDRNSAIDYVQTFAHRPPDTSPYTILLAHRPNEHRHSPPGSVDLQISGHTHGGQIFPFHFVSWANDGLLAGLYTLGDLKVYVTRGSGQWGPQMRFLAPAEITHIRLVPQARE